jgi:hypothetical protein
MSGFGPIGEVAARLAEVRLAGYSRPDLLALSSSHFGPKCDIDFILVTKAPAKARGLGGDLPEWAGKYCGTRGSAEHRGQAICP